MDKSVVEESAKELFEKLNSKVNLAVEEQEDSFIVKVDTQDTGILIGYHGESLSSLQLVLSLIVYKKIGKWCRISLRVGDYIEKREEVLKSMAQRAVEKVLATNTPVVLPFLRADERRVIHLFLEGNPNIVSASEGEGESRRLVIHPKNS